MLFRRLKGAARLVTVSDSAFQALDSDGLAVRGCFTLLVEATENSPGGRCMVIDYYSRKQPHVCRATFAAELHAALDAANHGLKILACLTEIQLGSHKASKLLELQNAGSLAFEHHLCIDARSVFDAVANTGTPKPAEEHMTLHVLKLQEWLREKLVDKLWWIDTRDMIADGLTKGSVDRTAILRLTEQGEWLLQHEAAALPP